MALYAYETDQLTKGLRRRLRLGADPSLAARVQSGQARLFLACRNGQTVGAAFSENGKELTALTGEPAARALLQTVGNRALGLPPAPDAPELWDMRDETGEVTGRITSRDQYKKLQSGEYALVVHIYLFTPDGRCLIQKRSETKAVLPGVWDITGGSAMLGEDGLTAALRETREEVGLVLEPGQLVREATLLRRRSFLEIWSATLPIDPSQCVLEPSEVEAVRLVSREELCRIIQTARYRDRAYKACVLSILKK